MPAVLTGTNIVFFMENPSRQILDDIASLIVSVKSQLSLLEEKLTELSAYTEQDEKPADPEDVTTVTPVDSSSDGNLFSEGDKTVAPAAGADTVPAADQDTAAADTEGSDSGDDTTSVDDTASVDDTVSGRDAGSGAGAPFHIDAGDLLKEAEHLVYETGYAENHGYVADEPVHDHGSEQKSDAGHEAGHEEPEQPVHDKTDNTPHQNQTEHLAVMDVLAEKEAWKKDRPGMSVRDVRSAISLNDRALFIRSLFREDPLLFSQTLVRINAMDSLEEVEKTLRRDFPEWNMESEVVYRFMMCVRRKVG